MDNGITESFNISGLLTEVAARYPSRPAIYYPEGRDRSGRVSYTHLSYSQLESLSSAYAEAFSAAGITKGVKTLVMLRPGLDFIAVAFAVFKTGAVPILIDPGMGRKNLLGCIRDTAPEALIAVSELHWISKVFLSSFKSVRIKFSLGKIAPPGLLRLEPIAEKEASAPDSSRRFPAVFAKADDMAAILFTTGSTGAPKGVVYTHGIFMTQTMLIKDVYGAGPDEVDMPAFPLFALFSAALGMTCVIPDMDPTRPAKVNPARIIEAVNNFNVSFSFGSPALWRAVAEYCIERNIKLPSLKKVLMAGAPVGAELHAKVKKIIAEDGETLIPYGATEALPIANFCGSEMLEQTASMTAEGKGYCVGYQLPGITIRVIKALDGVISMWNPSLLLPPGEKGELVIKGPVVTPEYYNRKEATALAKIRDTDGKLWHRMGDVGYIDKEGRIWFCGRKAHRVITQEKIYYSVCTEAIFNRHPDVFRTALVGVGHGGIRKPLIIVEPLPGKMPASTSAKEIFIKELKELGRSSELSKEIDTFLFHSSFPVDIRHNAKIFREKLAVWAEKQLA